MSFEIKRSFFAAANTGDGFKSFFEETFFAPTIERRYIIKGGPGTGKSSLLKRIALHAEDKGNDVEYYYCSSDTRSLDGIVLNGSVAFFDGTAPHSYDTVLPGACDEIIDLGRFWSGDRLRAHKREISVLNNEKKQAYAGAYTYLAAARELGINIAAIRQRTQHKEKLVATARRIYERLELAKNTGACVTRQVSAIGAYGESHLDTLMNMASKRYLIRDCYGVGRELLANVLSAARSDGVACYVSYELINSEYPQELYFPDVGVWIGISDTEDGELTKADSVINTRRFIDMELLASSRREYRAAARTIEACIALACERLREAGRIHAELESIYISSMDFEAQSDFCTHFINRMGL